MSQQNNVHTHEGGTLLPKKDEKGRIYREVRCPNCRAWICDEYVREGRIRAKCFRCGRIMIMEFRPFRPKKGRSPSKQLNKEGNTNG